MATIMRASAATRTRSQPHRHYGFLGERGWGPNPFPPRGAMGDVLPHPPLPQIGAQRGVGVKKQSCDDVTFVLSHKRSCGRETRRCTYFFFASRTSRYALSASAMVVR